MPTDIACGLILVEEQQSGQPQRFRLECIKNAQALSETKPPGTEVQASEQNNQRNDVLVDVDNPSEDAIKPDQTDGTNANQTG